MGIFRPAADLAQGEVVQNDLCRSYLLWNSGAEVVLGKLRLEVELGTARAAPVSTLCFIYCC